MDSVNSTTFIKRPPRMTDTDENFLYTKEVLSGRIFLAQYDEKRYVPVLQAYRDVVIISPEETELLRDLDKIRKKWLGVRNLKWVGITGPDDFGFPKGHCLWVKATNLSMGQYWFQIKHVRLVDQEIIYQLKCIRKSQTPSSANTPENKKEGLHGTKKRSRASTSVNTSSSLFNIKIDKGVALQSFQESCIEAINIIRSVITWRNFCNVIKVGCALLIFVVMGISQMIPHLGNYVLKLIREITFLVNAVTPIFIKLIDLSIKFTGGLFNVIAWMFRGGNHTVYPQYRKTLHTTATPLQSTPVGFVRRNHTYYPQYRKALCNTATPLQSTPVAAVREGHTNYPQYRLPLCDPPTSFQSTSLGIVRKRSQTDYLQYRQTLCDTTALQSASVGIVGRKTNTSYLQYRLTLCDTSTSVQSASVDWRERNRILRQELLFSSQELK